MKRVPRTYRRRGAFLVAVVCVVGALLVELGGGAGSAVGAGQLKLSRLQNRTLSGFASFEFSPAASATEARPSVKPAAFTSSGSAPTTTSSSSSGSGGSFLSGCPFSIGDNVNVSQNCLNITDADLQGRGQAQNETAIAQDPNDPSRLVATYNDYRRGDGTCGQDMSNRGGTDWQDVTTPNGFVRGTAYGGVAREYFQASGDPSVAWDTKGNAYFNCMMFQRGEPVTNNPDVSSGIYLFRSTGNGGASWNFTGRPVAEESTSSTSGLPLLDKPYMTVDDHKGSFFQDRIYATWTKFDTDGSGKIFEAYSNDYGETFSAPVLVSGASSLCPNGITGPNTCDNDQFSQPFTGSDGSLYVVFANYNNALSSATDNHNQILLAKSTDGGKTFGAPVKVADFNDLPDCATYQGGQDAGRACIPEKGSSQNSVFRAANYPAAALNPKNRKQIVVTFASYISQDSNPSNGCVPNGINPATGANLYTGVKTAGACNNEILYSVSNDGGASFTGTTTGVEALPTVNQDRGQAQTDQFWQWAAFSKSGKLAVSYFDRQYGHDETTGSSDISLSASTDLATFATQRVTTSSMPVPTQFPDAQGNSLFYGDYSGLSVGDGIAHPLWMDTREPDLFLCPGTGQPGVPPRVCKATEPNGLLANDQRIYTATVPLYK
jgi:hypothetical protein